MRSVPESMIEPFNVQQGVEPVYIIGIKWNDLENEILYSTREFTGVYAYIKEIQNFSDVAHVDGFGNVSTISIVLNDMFGHFKERIDKSEFYSKNTIVTCYLGMYGTEDRATLFKGFIDDDPQWTEDGKILTLSVSSKTEYKEVCYTPDIADVDESDPNYEDLKENLLSSAWPEIFGTVKNLEAVRFKNRVAYELASDKEFTGAGLYTFALENENKSFDIYPEGVDMYCFLKGEDNGPYLVIVKGQFSGSNFVVDVTAKYADADDDEGILLTSLVSPSYENLYVEWYTDIHLEILDPGSLFSGDEENDLVKMRIVDLFEDYTIGDITYRAKGPKKENLTVTPWLQYMRVQFRLYYEGNVLAKTGTVVRQEDDIIYVEGVTRHSVFGFGESGSVSLPDIEDARIYRAGKWSDGLSIFKKGTKLYALDDVDTFIIDSKTSTIIDSITIDGAKGNALVPSALYTQGTSSLFIGQPQVARWIKMNTEALLRYFDNLKDDGGGDGILISAHNSYTDSVSIIQYLLRHYGDDDTVEVIGDTTTGLGFAYTETEDVVDVVPEIAYQCKKALRATRSNDALRFELVNLEEVDVPIFEFNDSNIKAKSIRYIMNTRNDIRTVINSTYLYRDYLKETRNIVKKNNVDLYGELVADVDLYIGYIFTTAKDVAQFWINRLSTVRRRIGLTGYLDAFKLEVWDRVSINVSDPTFYDYAIGSPLTNTHDPTPISWQCEGFVREIEPRLKEGEIDFVIEIDALVGDTPNQTIRRIVSS